MPCKGASRKCIYRTVITQGRKECARWDLIAPERWRETDGVGQSKPARTRPVDPWALR